MARFAEKTVIVTGGSLGIGEAAVRAFAAEGGKVVVASRDGARASALVEKVAGAGGAAVHVETDVADEFAVMALVDRTLTRFGRLDILVNNAAIYLQGDAADTRLDEWSDVMAVNLTGAFLCTKYAVEALARQRGAIVNVASEAGLVGIANQVAYNVSKAALIALTKSCAVDFASRGVRVNCLCPGTTATPLVDTALARAPDPAAARRRLETIRPLGRLGTADEIASAILYLASEDAAYATGAVLAMDGGYTAQ